MSYLNVMKEVIQNEKTISYFIRHHITIIGIMWLL